ncbi:stage II sporulation protein R, partial [Hydrogenibacillus schlegelii]
MAFGRQPFPAKPFGDRWLPAGDTEALVVTLGAGRGHNLGVSFSRPSASPGKRCGPRPAPPPRPMAQERPGRKTARPLRRRRRAVRWRSAVRGGLRSGRLSPGGAVSAVLRLDALWPRAGKPAIAAVRAWWSASFSSNGSWRGGRGSGREGRPGGRPRGRPEGKV